MPQTDIASQDWSYDGVNAPAPSVAGMPNSIDSMAPPSAGKTLPPKTGGDPISGSPAAGGQDIYSGGADLYRQHLKDETERDSKTDRLIAQDRERLDKAQAQEAHAPQDIHDWNEEAQKEKYAAKPLQSFGSLGVIFATLASAFTHQPMINALNGSAAAMNAIKDGKDEEYKRAFAAWKENTDLAVKRQQMQHQTYEDAFKLLDTDITLGAIKSKEAAQRFGDQQMLFFIDNGMWDEADKLKANRLKYAEGIQDLSEKSDDYHMRGWAFQQKMQRLSPEDQQNPDVVTSLWNDTHDIGKTNEDQEALHKWKLAHPLPSDPDAQAQYFKDYTAFGQSLKSARVGTGTANQRVQQGLYDRLEAAKASGDTDAIASAQQAIDDYHSVESRPGTGMTGQEAKAVEEILTKNPGMSRSDAIAQVKGDTAKAVTAAKDTSGGVPKTMSGWQAARMKQLTAPPPAGEGMDPGQAATQVKQEFSTAKPFTRQEEAQLEVTPSLMKHLQTLDWFATDVTGPVQGVPEEIAAKYGGINDPAIIYHTALNEAEALMTQLGGSGRVSVKQIQYMLDTLPKDYQAARFNRTLIQNTMQDVVDQSRIGLSALEAGGKKIPPSVMDEFTKSGIFPESVKNKDPLMKFRKDPASISDADLGTLVNYAGALPDPDQTALLQEVLRRKQARQTGSQGAP